MPNYETELENVKELVEELMTEDTRARNNDLYLTLMIWQKKQQIKLFIPYESLKDMIMPSTISRVRRQIQNTENKLLPTDPNVLIQRKIKEEAIRNYYSSSNPFVLEEWKKIKFRIQ